MMTIMVGGQFGDEGKGGIADFLSDSHDIFVRFNGGANAGNSVVLPDGKKLVFKLLPAGGLKPGAILVLTEGMCIGIDKLTEEILTLRRFNKDFTVLISDKAIIINNRHREEDKANQAAFSSVGTGVGPANADRMRRLAEVMGVFNSNNLFRILDTGEYLNDKIEKGKNILFIGAHGTELDIHQGGYPYVTTSNCISSSIGHQAGVHPSLADEIVLCVKAYSTRVGQGKFNDVDEVTAHTIREIGHEYGSVSGRPRRIGWIDLNQLKRSVRINRPTVIALTMVDVLAGFDTIGIWDGEFDGFGILEHIPGWNMKDIEDYISHRACNAFSLFLTKIELATKCTVGIISYGSEKGKKVRI